MPRTVKAPPTRWQDVGELLKQLGNISPRRIRMDPLPGTATEKDLLRMLDHGNRLYTRGEMLRKLKEYFLAGVQLVWFVDPAHRCVTVYRSPEDALLINENQTLDGGDVLPGFRLPLKQLFARMPAVSGKKTSPKRKKA